MGDHVPYCAVWLVARLTTQDLVTSCFLRQDRTLCCICVASQGVLHLQYWLLGIMGDPLQAQTTLITIAYTVYGILGIVRRCQHHRADLEL